MSSSDQNQHLQNIPLVNALPTEPAPGRFLGVDFGLKRIGLAISDPDGLIASPLKTIAFSGDDRPSAIAVLDGAEGYDITALVVGLPLNMDGSEGPQAMRTRQFGCMLAKCSTKMVYYWDERLTSAMADDMMRAASLTRNKRKTRIDRIAAQMILQGFLDAKGWMNDGDV